MNKSKNELWFSNDQMAEMFETVKNWGRWGKDDERGALNYINDEIILLAAQEIKTGETVSCARRLDVIASTFNPNPALHMMVQTGDGDLGFSADFIGVAFHGFSTSHIDALCHVFVNDQMYNGFPATAVKSSGAKHCDIMSAKDGIIGRGVLLDIPKLKGVDFLQPGMAITKDELSSAEKAQNINIKAGDILLITTGREAFQQKNKPLDPFGSGLPGLHPECIPWLHEKKIAVLGSDVASDVMPGKNPSDWMLPVHKCVIASMGVHILDNLRLDQLSDACIRHNKWSFYFSISPLRIKGGTGSPVNPIAVF